MARPTVSHSGFLIPNASDVSNPRMAEPDRVDFNTLAHPLWGVVEGCEVTVAGTSASTAGGTLLVNGNLVTMGPGSVSLGISSGLDRFILVGSNAAGTLTMVAGEYSADPVFPDPPLGVTVLAAVFCPTGEGSLVDNVIDKRKFVSKALLTKIGVGADLIRNVNGTGNHFLLDGGGKATWENDTRLFRASAGKLSIEDDLDVKRDLFVGRDASVNGKVEALGAVTGSNLRVGTGALPGAASVSDIYQDKTTGKIYVWRSGAWQELATIQSANPPGTVITSLEKPTVMSDLGWVPLDGRTITETEFPTLFAVTGLAHLIQAGAPRTMTLPNAHKLALIVDWEKNPGLKVSTNPGNKVTLATTHMPRHGHVPSAAAAGAANPTATMNIAGEHAHSVSGGAHSHPVTDGGHRHNGADHGAGGGIVCAAWMGTNKLDALFNDRNHTWSVEVADWTRSAQSNVSVGSSGSEHTHTVSSAGGHTHTVTVGSIANHTHVMSETQMGNSTPFDTTPEYLTVYSYIRS